MTTPKYNPPKAKSWQFSLSLCLISVITLVTMKIIDCPNPTWLGEIAIKAPYPLMTVSAIWMLAASRLKGM